MPPVGFETTISAGEQQKTYALDRTATGTGSPTLSVLSKYLHTTNLNVSKPIHFSYHRLNYITVLHLLPNR